MMFKTQKALCRRMVKTKADMKRRRDPVGALLSDVEGTGASTTS